MSGPVARSIASATCSSSFGSLHAPRHATMHMCALSDTTLGPKSCATSVGHASRATHGENVRIDSPSHSAHSAAVALITPRRGPPGADPRARARTRCTCGRGGRRWRHRAGGRRRWRRRAGGRTGGRPGLSPAPRVVVRIRVVAEILLGAVSLGGVGRRNLAAVPRTARGSAQRPSQRAQAVRSRLVVAGVCDTGRRDRVRLGTGAEGCAAGAPEFENRADVGGEGGARTELSAEPVQSHGGEDIVIALLDRLERVRLLLVAHVGARRQ